MDDSSVAPGETRLVHDTDRDRYEAHRGEEVLGVLQYGDVADPDDGGPRLRDLRSTVVAPEHSGQGIGSMLVRFALDDIRASGLRAQPTCWFVRGWIQRHPDYHDLLADAADLGEETR
ncbi:GNAT family N-acetyltransferase [Brachybacterium sp. DNPG3]